MICFILLRMYTLPEKQTPQEHDPVTKLTPFLYVILRVAQDVASILLKRFYAIAKGLSAHSSMILKQN